MKRWAALVLAFYAVAFVVLTAPMVLLGTANIDLGQRAWVRLAFTTDPLEAIAEVYFYWGYWVWLAVMLAGQALLLLVPMDVARERPVSRRKLMAPVVVAAFFFANLVLAGVFCLLFAQFRDSAPDKVLFWTNYGLPEDLAAPAQAAMQKTFGFKLGNWDRTRLGILSILLLLWGAWTFIFYYLTRHKSAQAAQQRLLSWLLKGSILEFLVAVPCHVVVRGREDCCAPAGTFWGMAAGLAVMLLCFGPGLFFLFRNRLQRLRPPAPITDRQVRAGHGPESAANE
mgnify:CR=1 FL=1